MRIKFKKGNQREFLKDAIKKLEIPSLRSLNQFGFGINYSTLKDYYQERRLLPEEFFNQLCQLIKVNPKKLEIKYFDNNWGKVKGGKK